MTEDRVPTTEAGRNTLRQPPGSLDEWRGAILAIEAEASAEGWNRANDAARAAAAEQPAPPLDVERLTILSREMAWAAEETRQRLLVNEEHRDHSPDEGWERLTEFQRDQWIRRAADILARLSRPSDERIPESEAPR